MLEIFETIQRHGSIADSQYWFTKDTSCLTNVLSFLKRILDAAHREDNYDIIYLKFDKTSLKFLIKDSYPN